MRIAFIGHHDFGRAALDAFLARGDRVAAVFCAPEKAGAPADAVRVAAEAHGLPLFQFTSLRSPAALEAMRNADVDLAVMAYVLQFAPHEFVSLPRHGTIQYHPSLLPKHRGPSSISWPIALGATETGLTIFRPTDGLDEGPVILQKAVPIGPDDTLGNVYFDKLFPLGIAALLEASTLVVAGRHTEVAQDESKATYEGWFLQEESRINWANHVDAIYNLIRACNPAPGAWTMLGEEKVWLFDCRKHASGRHGQVRARPGQIAAITDDAIFIAAQGGEIEVRRLRATSGPKVNAGAFARERKLVSAAASR
jgi:methionyl-tRNA formyltransferase